MKPYPREALDRIVALTTDIWPRWRDRRLLITGATGFMGSWLAQAVIHANHYAQARVHLIATVRDVRRAERETPWLARDATLVAADLACAPPPNDPVDLIVHAAALVPHGRRDPVADSDVVGATLDMTRNMLEFAAQGSGTRLLFTSSGAVYGAQPAGVPIAESRWLPGTAEAAATATDSYGRAKREAEMRVMSAMQRGTQTSIARIFALIGPGLALDGRYAAGNFVRDALAGRDVSVTGDGRALRSWLDASDACVWLLRMLADAPSGFIANVGSDDARSISALARLIAESAGVGYAIAQPATNGEAPQPSCYVPDIRKARETLALRTYTTLEQSVARMLAWHRNHSP
jgi:dTDP-glucose 4,6-dehydratase